MTTQTKERPILFSGEMVKAILAGKKTQTRRVVKPQFRQLWGQGVRGDDPNYYAIHVDMGAAPDWHWIKCPYGTPGDRLWVRETFDIIYRVPKHFTDTWHYLSKMIRRGPNGERWVVDYKADNPNRNIDKIGKRKWRPSIHMPRWASRIMLEVTEVRVERLHKISYEDCMNEGVMQNCGELIPSVPEYSCGDGFWTTKPRTAFSRLWDSINSKHPWETNPWVWVVEFKVI